MSNDKDIKPKPIIKVDKVNVQPNPGNFKAKLNIEGKKKS
jgi:hypothetical protein